MADGPTWEVDPLCEARGCINGLGLGLAVWVVLITAAIWWAR